MKILRKVTLLTIVALSMFVALPVQASTDHSNFFHEPLNSGPEVTKKCLECHADAAVGLMKTSHWTWSSPQKINGKEVERGKKNAINNFCVSIDGNEPRCTSCHIGYGWKDKNFDFSDATLVDCLACHDTTDDYKKTPTGAGMPDPSVDLLYIARNVGAPSRSNCGNCHFFGGGGDAVKHGDLDESLAYSDETIDVHMNVEDLNFTCQECHTTDDHFISGNAMVVSPSSQTHIGCTNCHDKEPHNESLINQHMERVACQTCHIPSFAKETPTKTSWDWSTAGQDIKGEKDQYGKPTYMKKKGSFTWGKNITPTYAWYNGTAGAYLPGDKMNSSGVTKLSYPEGSRADHNAKIYPFKVHTGKQIYDKKNKYLITPKLFGKGGYWKTFDWDAASKLGMKSSGLKYSGEYGFAETIMYWRINHMVAPKEQALGCLDCHGDNCRIDWQELGYKKEPLGE